ncbi:MAG: hypothetical protein MUO33_10420, partial [Sedimentisphaerales bacterium]|nr:hypothetical protein [Sedimentisphaerales bacterium]
RTSRGTRTQPAWSEEEFERQLPRVNPLGCLTIIPVPVSNAPALSRYPIVTWTLVAINVLLYAFVGPQPALKALCRFAPGWLRPGVTIL